MPKNLWTSRGDLLRFNAAWVHASWVKSPEGSNAPHPVLIKTIMQVRGPSSTCLWWFGKTIQWLQPDQTVLNSPQIDSNPKHSTTYGIFIYNSTQKNIKNTSTDRQVFQPHGLLENWSSSVPTESWSHLIDKYLMDFWRCRLHRTLRGHRDPKIDRNVNSNYKCTGQKTVCVYLETLVHIVP